MSPRRNKLSVLFLVTLLSYLCKQPSHCAAMATNLPFSVTLASPDVYQLFWNYDKHLLTFEIHVRTHGWVGFGLSHTGGMVDADLAIAWVERGSGHIQDYYSESNGAPTLDVSQDWQLLHARENSSHTIIGFQRARHTCDQQDIIITDNTVRIIWSYSLSDPLDAEGELDYHGTRRGSRSLQLITRQLQDPRLPADAFSLEFLNPGVMVPGMDTTYWCQFFRMPHLRSKHHVVMFEPVIQEGHESLVHHVLLFGCSRDRGYHDNFGTICNHDQITSNEDDCSVLFAWAIGGGGFYFPSHVGYPLGGSDFPRFLRMETHYDNPERASHYMDSSGLRLWLSPSVRTHDVGVIETGIMVSSYLLIPPGEDHFQSQGHCVQQCLSQAMGNQTDGIRVFASLLHTHLAGSSIQVRHFRGDRELPVITKDLHYDFDYQETRLLKHEVPVSQGDSIRVDCTYNTKGRKKVTKGGLTTQDEMCLAYLWYYPRLDLANCQSVPTPQQSLQVINATTAVYQWGSDKMMSSIIVRRPSRYQGLTLGQVAERLPWTPKQRHNFQQVVLEGSIISRCQMGSTHKYDAHYQILRVPDVTEVARSPRTSAICSSRAAGWIYSAASQHNPVSYHWILSLTLPLILTQPVCCKS